MISTTLPIKCDTCGKDIKEFEHGMVEWIDDNKNISEVRIVHHPSYSPKNSCYKHSNEFHRMDLHLHQVVNNSELKKKLGLS